MRDTSLLHPTTYASPNLVARFESRADPFPQRGAGGSTKPRSGFDKTTMARNLHTLITSVLSIKEPIHLVGHDIGAMIVHAYDTEYPSSTASICTGEAALPGSPAFEARAASLGAWHYTFHAVLDLPELLVAGKERIYLKHMYDRLSQNPDAISDADLGVYAQSYSQPGALRCGFDVYRAFEEDAVANEKRVEEKGKCGVRCLALWGEKSYTDEEMATAMVGRYFERVAFGSVKGAGHWVAEENPGGFVESVLAWVGRE